MSFRAIRVLPAALLGAASIAFLMAVRQVLLPFLLSGLLAYFASPLLRAIERRGIRRDAGLALLYAALAAASFLAGYFGVLALSEEATELRLSLPHHLEEALPALKAKSLGSLPVGAMAVHYVEERLESLKAEAAHEAPLLVVHVLEASLYCFIVPMLSFFAMVSAPKLLQALLSACPARHVERVLNLVWALDETIGRYLRAVILQAALVGASTLVGLTAAGVHYAVWLSLFAGAANLVPHLGLLASGALAVAAAFLQFGDAAGIAKVVAVFVVVKMLDELVFQPLLLERAVHLHPVAILFALSCGAHLGGVLGLLFAVPATAILRLLLSTAWEWYETEFGEERAAGPSADLPLV